MNQLKNDNGSSKITARQSEAESPELAIKSEFGVDVIAASAFKFDFCSQDSTENGYRYWLLDSVSDGATLRSEVNEAGEDGFTRII